MSQQIYKTALGLLTDLYQLTMGYGYWKHGLAEREAVFHLHFRRNPFQGGFTLAVGLEQVLRYVEDFRFDSGDIEYLASLAGNDGKALFEKEFLTYLQQIELRCSIDAVPEGTVVFPHEPVLRVRAPLLQAQLLETPFLNILNFQSLIATKAARICLAARGDPVLEFGLRRAQSTDGALSASRAAFIGGCSATSNVLAGRMWGIPVRGTHAHSWVLAFDDEARAFRAYSEAMPNNAILLVDTYDTMEGVRNAIEAGRKLRQNGFDLEGIRLDSGDLAELSRAARRALDDAGFQKTRIVASNDLDEYRIRDLKERRARIDIWGVGTRMVTGHGEGALPGVYKLGAVRDENQRWCCRSKVSDQIEKASIPGILGLRRFFLEQRWLGDGVFNELGRPGEDLVDYDWSPQELSQVDGSLVNARLLTMPVMQEGRRLSEPGSILELQARVRKCLASMPPGLRSIEPTVVFPVALEKGLSHLRDRLLSGRSEVSVASI